MVAKVQGRPARPAASVVQAQTRKPESHQADANHVQRNRNRDSFEPAGAHGHHHHHAAQPNGGPTDQPPGPHPRDGSGITPLLPQMPTSSRGAAPAAVTSPAMGTIK